MKTAPLRPGEQLFNDGETSVSSITETIGGGGRFTQRPSPRRRWAREWPFLGKVGADGLGDRLLRALTQHGISPHLARSTTHPSGNFDCGINFDNGQRHFISCLPANEALCFADLDWNAAEWARPSSPAPMSGFRRRCCLRETRNSSSVPGTLGVATSIDINWDPQWGRAGVEVIRGPEERGSRPCFPGWTWPMATSAS